MMSTWSRSEWCQTPIGRVQRVAHPDAEPISIEQARKHLRLTPIGSPPSHPDDQWLQDFAIGAARELCEQETGLAFAPATFDFSIASFPSTRYGRAGRLCGGLTLPMAAPLIEILSVTYTVQDTANSVVLDSGLVPTSEVVLAIDGTLLRVSALTLKDGAATPVTLVEDTDYTFNKATGTITMLTAAGVQPYVATYTYTATRVLEAGEDFVVDVSTGPAALYPAPGIAWPATYATPGAVVVRFRAGYDIPGSSPVVRPLPYVAQAAMRLALGHLYENREATTDLRMIELPLGVRDLLRPLSILYEFA